MKHTKKDGTNLRVFVLLHGTGGNAVSLFSLADLLDPDATYLGMEGDVNEHGKLRFFERTWDGKYNLESLDAATHELHKQVIDLLELYDLGGYEVILLGYSNGANLVLNLLKEYSMSYALAILLHPSASQTPKPFLPQSGLKVMMTFGEGDPYTTRDEFVGLVSEIESAGIPLRTYTHGSGHSITEGELYAAIEELGKLDKVLGIGSVVSAGLAGSAGSAGSAGLAGSANDGGGDGGDSAVDGDGGGDIGEANGGAEPDLGGTIVL